MDPAGLHAALDVLAVLLPQELMASIQQHVKARVVPPVSWPPLLADLSEKAGVTA